MWKFLYSLIFTLIFQLRTALNKRQAADRNTNNLSKLLHKLKFTQLVNKFPAFCVALSALTYLRVPAIWTRSETGESITIPNKLYL